MKVSVIRKFVIRLWYSYKNFVGDIACRSAILQPGDLAYWREALFTSFVTYLLPLCLIALVPCVWISFKDGYFFIAVFDLLAAGGVALGTFNCHLSLNFRKTLIMGILYALSVVLLVDLGLFGPGLIYLFALSVFITLVFPRQYAYWSVTLSLLICICCGLIIHFNLFSSPLVNQYNLGAWIAISSNLVFLSWVGVLLISKTIHGLERVITKDFHLTIKLRQETADGILRNQQLKESEGYYKKLFFQGPSPMWILDSDSLKFLQVNESAIQDYGYTSQEFLAMTIMDIKLPSDLNELHQDLQKSQFTGTALSITTRHRRKNQESFPVEVKFNAILFKGKDASLVIARDISEQVDHIRAIECQNAQLMEIAFIQSHLVRAPLARIMGLVDIMMACPADKKQQRELLGYLDQSARDLDDIVRKTVDSTQEFHIIRKAN